MPGIYDITDKTYDRPADRVEETSLDFLYAKYAGVFGGNKWLVPHNLHSTNLLISLWKFDVTNPASFWKIEQIDYDNLEVSWTLPVTGKVAIYAVRDWVGVSMVYNQTVAATVWTINHNFGTDAILYTVWEDNNTVIVPAIAKTLDNNNIELTFPTAVQGKAILLVTDPKITTGLTLTWSQIAGKPATFPPDSHRHDASEIDNITAMSLSGHPISDFVLWSHVGTGPKGVAPVAFEKPGDTQPKIPVEFMPTNVPFRVGDSDGEMTTRKLLIDSTSPVPLFLTKDTTKSQAILSMKPVFKKITLMGNYVPNLSLLEQAVEASSDFLFRLDIGTGLTAQATDKHTLKIASQMGTAKSFSRIKLAAGATWSITDTIFATMADYTLTVYETITTSAFYSADSYHILGQTDMTQPFEISGDKMLEISGNVVQDKQTYTASHFLYGDSELKNGTVSVAAPSNVDAVYWDSVSRVYVVRCVDTTYYTFRSINPLTKAVAAINTINFSDVPEWNTQTGGMLYALSSVSGGAGFEVLYDVPTNAPWWGWSTLATFPSSPYPTISVTGTIIMRLNGNYLVLLNTEVNSLSVYEIATSSKLHELPLPMIGKDFDLWPDDHISIIFDGEQQIYSSDKPIWDPSYTFIKGVDDSFGFCDHFALGDASLGFAGLGVKPSNVTWQAPNAQTTASPVYACGEETIWVKSPFAFHVNPLWSKVTAMSWENYDISPYDDVRIGFYPSKMNTMPAQLYRWNGTDFDSPYPASDLPLVGQPLATLNTISLPGNTDFSYAIYIKKPTTSMLKQGFIVHNFKLTYQLADAMYPVPIGGPANTDHLLVKCTPGILTLENNLGRDLDGVKVVAIPAL